MNTKDFLPFKCISINILANPYSIEHPGLNGTGFFCDFPPFDYIFYVTARHCLKQDQTDDLLIPYSEDSNEAVKFSLYLSTPEEDILIFVVDNDVSNKKKNILRKRLVHLKHQEDIDSIIKHLCEQKSERVRTIGYPLDDTTSTGINFEEQKVVMQPRGFHGVICDTSKQPNRYAIEQTNWLGSEYRGFSGSPVFALIPKISDPIEVEAVVIGIMLTASSHRGEFLSINVVTDLIAASIVNNFENSKIE